MCFWKGSSQTDMFVSNGWTIYFHRVFEERYRELLARAARLKKRLPAEQYKQHPEVKLLARLNRVITETIPADPESSAFWLKGDLSKFRRTKGHGLPDRYRLFWAFSSRLKVIIILYLNDDTTLRKQGASSDPYTVFSGLLQQGELGQDFEANWRVVETELRRKQKEPPE